MREQFVTDGWRLEHILREVGIAAVPWLVCLKRYKKNLLQTAAADPAFMYEIARTSDGTPVGVIWSTGRHRELLATYGDVVWLDAKMGAVRERWPFVGPTVVDQEYHVRMVAHGFVCTESNEAYRYVKIRHE